VFFSSVYFMLIAIILVFIFGYMFIALESVTEINKSGIAILMAVVTWTLFAVGIAEPEELTHILERNLGEAGTTIFFLMGAMAIVELVDTYGGFNFVKRIMNTSSKRSLFWRMTIMTAIMSAILDNLTTTIVMLMILSKIVTNKKDLLTYSSMIVIAANAGGAFSPIGDVTTIMLWNGKMITALGVMSKVFLPSVASIIVPGLILQYRLKGQMDIIAPSTLKPVKVQGEIRRRDRVEVFIVGVGGLCCVPLFHSLTGLPPFVGILLVLALLWILTDIIHKYVKKSSANVASILSKIDMETILFFLGILLTVSVLSETGLLTGMGNWLQAHLSNDYLQTGIIGVLSSIVDNVPLVAAAMKMYPIADPAMVASTPALAGMVQDGVFWQLLAYCAGTGGSLLIIGSAAGVIAMGLQHIEFGWYLKNISWVALLGYLAGIAVYALEVIIGL